jgi:hypothetical protein
MALSIRIVVLEKKNSLPYSIDGSATKKFILNVEICLLDEANSG